MQYMYTQESPFVEGKYKYKTSLFSINKVVFLKVSQLKAAGYFQRECQSVQVRDEKPLYQV